MSTKKGEKCKNGAWRCRFASVLNAWNFKNEDGEYETDFIDCTVFDVVATNTAEYCNKGDIVGVRGRLQSRTKEEDGKRTTTIEVVADKVTFLSSRKTKDDEREEEAI